MMCSNELGFTSLVSRAGSDHRRHKLSGSALFNESAQMGKI